LLLLGDVSRVHQLALPTPDRVTVNAQTERFKSFNLPSDLVIG
jgi:hypothetical protein